MLRCSATRWRARYLLVACSLGLGPSPTLAQAFPAIELLQGQVAAAQSMILLGVQQGLSALPPSSAQSLVYDFDPESEVFVLSDRLGPTVFRSPEVLGPGRMTVRLGTGYFTQHQRFAPIEYTLELDTDGEAQTAYGAFGVDVDADVTVVAIAATYGVAEWLEARLTIPLVIVDVSGATLFYTLPSDLSVPAAQAVVVFGTSRESFDEAVRERVVVERPGSFDALGASFSEGTNVGLGRIAVGGKLPILRTRRVRLAVDGELFLPSPNEAEFAGPDSVAIFPRLIGALDVAPWLRAYLDVGYEYDFDDAPLRRFAWTVGASLPYRRLALDLGVGGSQFSDALEWTPSVSPVRPDVPGTEGVLFTTADNTLGTTFLNVLLGLKVKATDWLVFSGSLAVPFDDREFRPDVIGTIAAETTF